MPRCRFLVRGASTVPEAPGTGLRDRQSARLTGVRPGVLKWSGHVFMSP
ncbi:hypothetical protein MCBMB27_00447 [Methylobacterium phyllosphaerae]|uniref:Uncharacterized protein n=1 Tax=Methylobacterium phyllosphaerae TaxID=418223 RepID=A0ABM6FX83_9HYPH|nr:hypothetical protein MCBMB27_00447 [Methylobacterium phyllosphaerae]